MFSTRLLTLFAALALAACTQSNPEWERVRKLDTPDAYAKYEKQYSGTPEAELARTRRAALLDEREWNGASRVDTADAYAAYLVQHPNGMWAMRARTRQAELLAAAPAPPEPAAAEAVEAAAGVTAAPAPVPVPAAPPAPSKKTVGKTVKLQLGAFSSEDRAQKSWREAQRLVPTLRDAKPEILHGNGSNLHRLRVDVESRAEADRVCAALRKAGASCIVL